MFENIGNTLKSLAHAVLVLGIAASLIVAIILFAGAGNSYRNESAAAYATATTILIVGPVSSVISSIFIYGFGELVNTNYDIAQSIKSIEVQLKWQREDTTADPNRRTTSLKPLSMTQSTWMCPECGREHPTSDNSCPCGFIIEKDEESTQVGKTPLASEAKRPENYIQFATPVTCPHCERLVDHSPCPLCGREFQP